MAISKKGSHKIVIETVEFRWIAAGNDGWIDIYIWPEGRGDIKVIGTFDYHSETNEVPDGGGRLPLVKGQIIITNRVIKKIIEHIGVRKILESERQINLGKLENIYNINLALRVTLIDEKT